MSVAGASPQPAPFIDVAALAGAGTRLGRALALFHDHPKLVGARDLVGLVRAHLVAANYAEGVVPCDPPWPGPDEWRAATIDVGPVDGGLRLRPRAWLPEWRDAGDPPDLAPALQSNRRRVGAVTGDPFLPEMGGYHDYRSAGQREAIRAVLAAGPGRTVVAVLPTGSGKTLAVTGPALLAHRAHGSQTVMIVPTVALALDMERRLKKETGEDLPLAYHGGLTPDEKKAFRERLRSGEQWLVVTSPEAACTSLAAPLEEAALNGRLRYFAIDEAHIVTEWGDDFRPAFQAVAGVRRRLLKASIRSGMALTTVLLTGTLDDHGLRTLGHLFAEKEPLVIASQFTRPEPAYWHRHCTGEEEKRRLLLDAVLHLPKPLLVYASLRTATRSTNTGDVERWLGDDGFVRLLRVDGGSSAAIRSKAVRGLRLAGEPAEDLDVVAANSAFGLGMDIDDIRAVIHVCMPETIDRYYQEVGRGGRNGQAAISLLLWTDVDEEVARDMARTSAIGSELGWKRWRSMRHVDPLPDGHLPVNLTAFHDGVSHPGSDANRMWNLHTLTTMERAEMVRLHWTPPPDIPSDADDDAMLDAFERYHTTVEVEMAQGDLADEEVFRRRFDRARGAGIGHGAASLASMKEVLGDTETCVNRRFAGLYVLTTPAGDRYPVDEHCGGCPACRAAGREPRLFDPPPAGPPDAGRPALLPALSGLLENGRACIWYAGESVPWRQLSAVVRRLVEHGVRHLVLPAAAPAFVVREAMEASPDRWVCQTELGLWARSLAVSTMATFAVVPPDAAPSLVQEVVWRIERHPAVVAAVPRDLPDADEPKLFLRERLRPSYAVDAVLGRL
jgi:superfamily II DNA helicase RecQ